MKNLETIISNLKTKPEVDAVFLTGSHGKDRKPYSDIDLVIILNTNDQKLNSLYTWVDDTFTDVFFFDHSDIERIDSAKEIPGNTLDGVLVSWLGKATIQFDKSGKISALKGKVHTLGDLVKIPQSEKDQFWQKINYNLVANTRYFESHDPIYHEALEIRLLYSVSEVFTGYFEFRDILWRGEKNALKYLKENDIPFYSAFVSYTKATGLKQKFDRYSEMVSLVFPNGYRTWQKTEIAPQPKDRSKADIKALIVYWQELIK